MTLYISLDDTDMPDSPGTGRLAREIASILEKKYQVHGITRHQLFVHPDIPYTSHNSAAVLHLMNIPDEAIDLLFEEVAYQVKSRAAQGSDPGVCVARHDQVTPAVMLFGKDAKHTVLTQEQALILASNTGIRLVGLDGTKGGIIGSLAATGLAATGSDGRYIQFGAIRTLYGESDVEAINNAGINTITSVDGRSVMSGRISYRKFPQPVRIAGGPVLLVREDAGSWVVERRD